MDWTEKQILDALRFIEESEYDEVKLETENFRLHVRKSGAPAALDETQITSQESRSPAAKKSALQIGVHRRSSAAESVSPIAETPAPEFEVPPGMIAIRAPM